jgi:hypothetical protein
MEQLFRGKMRWKRDGDTDTNSNIFENGGSKTNDLTRDEGGYYVDIRGDEENANEGDDEKLDGGPPEENPTDEQQEYLPPNNRNSWSLTIILLMTR